MYSNDRGNRSSRSGITIRLQRRKEDQKIENFLSRKGVMVEAEELREWLTSWADQIAEDLNFNPEMPVTDRDREVWSPLSEVF